MSVLAPNGFATVKRVATLRDFGIYMWGGFPSYVTSWMQRLGVGWLAWEITHSTTWLGIVAAADLAPMILLAPLAGAFTDRGNAYWQFTITQYLIFTQAFMLALLHAFGALTIEALLALSLYSGLVFPLHQTSRHALVSRIVPRADLPPAIATDSALFQLSRAIGPAIAGFVILWFGVGATFIAHAIGSGAFALALLFMRYEKREIAPRLHGNLFTDVAEGFAYTRDHAGILPLFIMLTLGCALLRPMQEMLPAFAGAIYKSDARGLSWLAAAIGLGALVSAASLAVRGTIRGLTVVALTGFALMTLSTLGLVATDWMWLGILCAGVSGYGMNTMSTSTQTLTQSAVADSMRGRVMGLYSLIWRGSPALGAVLGGWIADIVGVRLTFAVFAGACMLAWFRIAPRRAAIEQAVEHPHD
jgi:MFS family permease